MIINHESSEDTKTENEKDIDCETIDATIGATYCSQREQSRRWE